MRYIGYARVIRPWLHPHTAVVRVDLEVGFRVRSKSAGMLIAEIRVKCDGRRELIFIT